MDSMLESLKSARTWYLGEVDALGEHGWQKASLCAGWKAANVVAHVAGSDYFMRALVYDATGRDHSMLAALPTDMASRVKRAEAMAGWAPAKLRETARTESEQTVNALSDVLQKAPQTLIRHPIGEVPATTLALLRSAEYIIHGHDLEPATGRRQPVPEWFIESALVQAVETWMMRMHQRSPHKGKAASFHLHRTDGEGEWTLRAEGGQAKLDRGHHHADVALHGPAAGLYWVIIGRGRPEEHGVQVHGDPALAAAFKEWFPGP